MLFVRVFLVSIWAVASAAPSFGQMQVVSVFPSQNVIAPVDTGIAVTFDRAVSPPSVTSSSFRVFGQASGPATGSYAFSNGNETLTFTPDQSFFHGEVVIVNVSHDVLGADAMPLRSAGFAFQFTTRTGGAGTAWSLLAVTTSQGSGEDPPRIYGAMSSDFNADGWVDLAAVNENAADIRVLLNTADGSGLFDDFLEPPTPLGVLPSPSAPADFDNDGNVDGCAANVGGNSVSIVLGNGDGSFAPHQEIPVGLTPNSIAALDVDGDADWDVVTTNRNGGDSLSLLLNDGNGVFGAATSIDPGIVSGSGVAAADMNNDGIFDLVVGDLHGSLVSVLLGNGDGTFTPMPASDAGGGVLVLVTADVNGDTFMDVSAANLSPFNAAILLGNGDGTLGPPLTVPAAGKVTSVDLGDVDGDDDLDWVISIFGEGLWRLYLNDGSGQFSFEREFYASRNPVCAVMVDFDNDTDLDLVLLDEISNDIFLWENMSTSSTSVPALSSAALVLLCLLLAGGAAHRLRR